MNNYWDIYYKTLPLNQIPWQKTQADYFKHLVDKKIISGKTALDLGCGTGKKSIYLVLKGGFEKVIGIDISPSAISYARKNARSEEVVNKVEFVANDVTDLNFLGKQTFDFILDWSVLHCLDPSKYVQYINGIVEHSHKGSLLTLRVFSKKGDNKNFFIDSVAGETNRIYLFDNEMIKKLYSRYFTILEKKSSKPRIKDNLRFREYLMKRK